MGKATVIGGGTGGLYTIKIETDRRYIDAQIERIENFLPKLEEALAEQEDVLYLQELELEAQRLTVDALIDELEQNGPPDGGDIDSVVSLHNVQRASAGLSQLTVSGALQSAAQAHANWMRDNDIGSHTGEGGSSPRQRATVSGYPPGDVGENWGLGYPNANSLFDGLMRSPGHKENILRPKWTQIGIGYAHCPGGLYRHFWVVKYGVPA